MTESVSVQGQPTIGEADPTKVPPAKKVSMALIALVAVVIIIVVISISLFLLFKKQESSESSKTNTSISQNSNQTVGTNDNSSELNAVDITSTPKTTATYDNSSELNAVDDKNAGTLTVADFDIAPNGILKGFSIDYPAGWALDTKPVQTGTIYSLTNLKENLEIIFTRTSLPAAIPCPVQTGLKAISFQISGQLLSYYKDTTVTTESNYHFCGGPGTDQVSLTSPTAWGEINLIAKNNLTAAQIVAIENVFSTLR
ncbi:MAG: hypothetical protein WCJ58_07075 [bacterium]